MYQNVKRIIRKVKWHSTALLRTELELRNKVLVGTHHKTGTVWIASILLYLSTIRKLKYFYGSQAELPEDFDIFFQDHSRFEFESLPTSIRGLHVIRDPRDTIVSGAFYHQKSREPWLHTKKQEFGGLTYQEKINSFSSLEDKILFEMENAGFRGIQEMLAWDYSNPVFIEAKYEDIIRDHDLLLFHKIFTFLGFPGQAIPEILSITYRNSLFSGSLKRSAHVRSGKTRQWEQYFTPAHKSRFLELFGDAATRLGYEEDDSWANA